MGYRRRARILFRHLLPNAITPVLVYWMTDMALAILLGSSLGYLGLGAQPPTSEWGVLIADGKNFMTTPGGCRSSPESRSCWPASAFSLLGDGLAAGCGAAPDARRWPSRISHVRHRRGGAGGWHRPRGRARARCWASWASPAPARA